MSSFISARELIETNTIPNTSNSNEHDSVDRTEDNIQKYIKKSKIKNTDACTQKWVRILQNYRKKKNIVYDIQSLTNKEQLEHELCEFFADIKRQDGKPYKVESIVSAYTSLRRFLLETSAIKNININDRFQFPILYRVVDGKCIELQDQGHGEIVQSKGLSQEEIRQILLYLNSGEQSALRLTWKVFFWNAYLLGLRGGDHYRILLNSFDFQLDGSLIFTIGREKNNPGGLNGRNKYGKFSSRNIHIPADLPNNEFKPVQDLRNYVSLRPSDACEKFYLQLTRNSQEIQGGNWFLKAGLGRHTLANMMNDIAQASKINVTDQRITNHSGRRTAIQLLSDLNINEHEMMQFSGHRSTNGLRSYKVPNREQKLKNTALLINAIQELQIPTQESQALTNDESQALIDKEPQALTNEESQTSTHKEPQISTQKNIRIKKRTSKLTEEEIQLKLVRPFRSPLQTLQNKTQNVVTTKDGTTNIFEFHNSGDVHITFK